MSIKNFLTLFVLIGILCPEATASCGEVDMFDAFSIALDGKKVEVSTDEHQILNGSARSTLPFSNYDYSLKLKNFPFSMRIVHVSPRVERMDIYNCDDTKVGTVELIDYTANLRRTFFIERTYVLRDLHGNLIARSKGFTPTQKNLEFRAPSGDLLMSAMASIKYPSRIWKGKMEWNNSVHWAMGLLTMVHKSLFDMGKVSYDGSTWNEITKPREALEIPTVPDWVQPKKIFKPQAEPATSPLVKSPEVSPDPKAMLN